MFEPARPLSIRLSILPAPQDWLRLDAWLASWLNDPPREWAETPVWAPSCSPAHTAARLAWRVALAAQALLDASGIPVTDPGRVIGVQADHHDGAQWHCELLTPHVEGVPAHVTTLAYGTCVEWLQRVTMATSGEDLLTPFYQHLETEVLPALLKNAMATHSTMALLRTASSLAIPWQHEGQGVFQLGWGLHAMHLVGSRIDSDSALGIGVAGHKLLGAQWLRRAGLPTSQHQMVSTLDHATHAAHLLGWPVVVKPVDRDRGEGVSVNVCDEASLRAAFAHAVDYSPQVLVEKQAPGVCHRLLVVRGQVMYAVKRLPVAVLGDGVSTARELIASANAHWRAQPIWRRPPPLPDDALAQDCLQRIGLSLDTTVPDNLWAPLRLIESSADGGRDEDVMADLHPDNIALAIRAAALFGLDMAGVDLISTDVSVPWHTNAAIINEVNVSPALGASQMSLDAMPAVLARLLPGGGRIPVDFFVAGAGALALAQASQQEQITQGLACYLTTETTTFDPQGHEIALTCKGLIQRCRALLSDKAIGGLVIVSTQDELASLKPLLAQSR